MKNSSVVLFIIWFAGAACGGGGGGGGGGGVTVPTPVVSITSINPTSGSAGGGTTVTISGSNFGSTATVMIGDTPLANVSVSGNNTITGTTGQSSTAGLLELKVTTANQAASLPNAFTYVAVLRAMINSTVNGSMTIQHNTPTNFTAAGTTTTSPYIINSYSWNCGQAVSVYGSGSSTSSPPVSPCQTTTVSPTFSYRKCSSSTANREPCTGNDRKVYVMTLTVTDSQGNTNSTNYNVTVTNQY